MKRRLFALALVLVLAGSILTACAAHKTAAPEEAAVNMAAYDGAVYDYAPHEAFCQVLF